MNKKHCVASNYI